MTELVICADDLDALSARLFTANVESVAVLLAHEVRGRDGNVRLLVRDTVFPSIDDYALRGPLEAEVRPDFVAGVSKRARAETLALVWVHSHGGADAPEFSAVDDEGERRLAGLLHHRNPGVRHAALVISKGGVSARELGSDREIRVISLGRERHVLFPSAVPRQADMEFDRQVRAFGPSGQSQLRAIKVAVVGLGGTGSIVGEQIVHLGVRDLVLIDADVLETTNLNRVAGSTPKDVGRAKVDVAADFFRSIAPDLVVDIVRGDVTRTSSLESVLDCDFIFGCTDSHGSRSAIQQVAYQYLIPCVDVGSTIVVRNARVDGVHGRVQLLAPGLACFTCGNLLDPNQVRKDMMSPFERNADPYISGVHEPAPAVMSLNGIVASLGVSMMLAVITGFPMSGRHLLYDGLRPGLRSVEVRPDPSCYICSRSGAFARGTSWPLFARNDKTVAD